MHTPWVGIAGRHTSPRPEGSREEGGSQDPENVALGRGSLDNTMASNGDAVCPQ